LITLGWIDPLALAATLDDDYWVLLYSGVQASYSGRYSYLACDLAERIEGTDFSLLEGKLSHDKKPWENAWFGYFGYGLKDGLETLAPDRRNWVPLPALCMMRFANIYVFDHQERVVTLHSSAGGNRLPEVKPAADIYLPGVCSVTSNMTTQTYLEKAADIIERIHAGELYQANLTRKWVGRFAEAPKPFDVFRRLCAVSPAPYSAYLQLGDTAVASSSPELFLNIEADGTLRTRPIKGTAPRSADPARDRQAADGLRDSAKDRAENLMIVDLMRNDLSRCCVPGSVEVSALFEVTSHASVHHMSSTVSGRKRPGMSSLDAIKCAFPPGSMTGAPKIRAMNVCSELEELERGLYSGALGWLGGDGSAALSVVIRTLILQGERFEFQVGGGIIADSTPQGELEETIDKSAGILAALGVSRDQIL